MLPNLRDGATAPGRLPQMAYGRGKGRRGSHRQRGTGAVRGLAAEKHCPVGPVPPLWGPRSFYLSVSREGGGDNDPGPRYPTGCP